MKHRTILLFCLLGMAFLGLRASAQHTTSGDSKGGKDRVGTSDAKAQKQYKVTFIELGSVKCIPCKKMQPVMKSIEKKYGDQVKVIFYDVWTPEGKPYGEKYGIEVIPVQVFLDEKGVEFYRHEGFFPEKELVKVLKSRGVK